MSEMDRNAILKQMGITQWVLREERGGRQPEQAVSVETDPGQSPAAVVDTPKEIPAEKTAPDKPAERTHQVSTAPPAVAAVKDSNQHTSRVNSLDELRQKVVACTACDLAATRTQTVFGEGPSQADWMFIGEAPGQQEDRQGRPFVGRAGALLTQMISALGYTREQVFIANTLKCRPPNNRDPHPDELAACEPFLLKQIELVRPKVIVTLGRFSASALLRRDEPLSRLRGQVYHYGPEKTPLIVTYHPAYLLRQPADKRKAWEDLLLAHRQIPV